MSSSVLLKDTSYFIIRSRSGPPPPDSVCCLEGEMWRSRLHVGPSSGLEGLSVDRVLLKLHSSQSHPDPDPVPTHSRQPWGTRQSLWMHHPSPVDCEQGARRHLLAVSQHMWGSQRSRVCCGLCLLSEMAWRHLDWSRWSSRRPNRLQGQGLDKSRDFFTLRGKLKAVLHSRASLTA